MKKTFFFLIIGVAMAISIVIPSKGKVQQKPALFVTSLKTNGIPVGNNFQGNIAGPELHNIYEAHNI